MFPVAREQWEHKRCTQHCGLYEDTANWCFSVCILWFTCDHLFHTCKLGSNLWRAQTSGSGRVQLIIGVRCEQWKWFRLNGTRLYITCSQCSSSGNPFEYVCISFKTFPPFPLFIIKLFIMVTVIVGMIITEVNQFEWIQSIGATLSARSLWQWSLWLAKVGTRRVDWLKQIKTMLSASQSVGPFDWKPKVDDYIRGCVIARNDSFHIGHRMFPPLLDSSEDGLVNWFCWTIFDSVSELLAQCRGIPMLELVMIGPVEHAELATRLNGSLLWPETMVDDIARARSIVITE